MKRRYYILSFVAAAVFAMVGCSTDFELNKPQEKTIIYGILDPTADTQWVKINKSFLGDGDNFVYAGIPDCTIYENISATVTEVGGANRNWTLNEKYIPVDPDAGIFYGDSQKVYYFVPAAPLDVNATYDLEVNFDDSRPSVKGSTKLVAEPNFDAIFKLQITQGIRFETGPDLLVTTYANVIPDWDAVPDGRRYDLKLIFNYTEHTLSGDVTEKSVEWSQGAYKTTLLDGSESFKKEINGEQFYQLIGGITELDDVSNIDKRVAGTVDFIVTVSEDELSTYLDVNQPLSGIVQVRPEYTNIENGIGIFSSINKTIFNRQGLFETKLSRYAVEELAFGQYTSGLKFCSDSAAYVGESYHCP